MRSSERKRPLLPAHNAQAAPASCRFLLRSWLFLLISTDVPSPRRARPALNPLPTLALLVEVLIDTLRLAWMIGCCGMPSEIEAVESIGLQDDKVL